MNKKGSSENDEKTAKIEDLIKEVNSFLDTNSIKDTNIK